MSQPDDCMDDVILPMDRDVERLLMGRSPEDDHYRVVVPVLTAMRTLRGLTPSPEQITAVAESAARISSGDRPAPVRRSRLMVLVPRLAAAVLAVLLVGGISSTAIAADGSAPGEALYGLDLALERVGIGAGGVNERILESAQLISRGHSDEAIIHLDDTVAHAPEAADHRTAERVELHLNLAENMANPNAAETQERVAAIRQFIEDNKGKDAGLDGPAFGAGISDAARGDSEQPTDSEEPSGKPESLGNGQGQGRGRQP